MTSNRSILQCFWELSSWPEYQKHPQKWPKHLQQGAKTSTTELKFP